MPAAKEKSQKVADYKISFKSLQYLFFLNQSKSQMAPLALGGLIFKPITTQYLENGQLMFHTHGLKIQAVAWDTNNPGSLQICSLEEEVYTAHIDLNPQGHTIPANQATKIFNETWETVYTDLLRFYKITGAFSGGPLHSPGPEFDLVYIDINKFCELAGITLVEFLPGQFQYEMGETGNYYQTDPAPADRGFEISRASFDFDYNIYSPTITTPVELGKARTLKFNPYPEPPLMTVMSRPSVAYQLGIPCPPLWHDGIESQLVARIFSQGIENNLIPEEALLPPDPPPAQPTEFMEAFRGNAWVKGMSVILLVLIAILLFLLSKCN